MRTLSICIITILAVGLNARDRNDYTKNPYRIVCYFGSWANYHQSEPFLIEDVNTDMCTHVNYGFAKLDEYNYTLQPFDPYLDTDWDTWDLKGYERFNELRKKNPQLTTMISLGGWYEGSEKYSDMARDPKLRDNFVTSVVKFLKDWNFDGLDFDWEYPGNRLGDKKVDKDNFLTLLKELREAFDPHGFLLTAAVSPGKPTIDNAYGTDLKELNKLLDWYNVMTYDYHGGWENNLGHNAPIYKRPDETDELSQWFNINYTIHYYLSLGAEKSKMVMGMPFYGRAWSLMSTDKVKLHDEARGMSPAGPISGQDGVLGYNELCEDIEANTKNWHFSYDPYYNAPYAWNDKIWIGFDNVESLACKLSYLKKMGLSGGMVWSLENDDFKGRCGGGVYPLLNKVYAMLNGKEKDSFECPYGGEPTPEPTTPTTPKPTTTTPEPTTTEPTTAKPTTTEPTTEPTTPTTPTTPEPTTPTTKPTTAEPTTEPTTEPTPSPTTPTPPAPTTEEPQTGSPMVTSELPNGHVIRCYQEGKIPHPTNIHKYVVCEHIKNGPNEGWYIHIMGCAPGTKWLQTKKNDGKCIDDNYFYSF